MSQKSKIFAIICIFTHEFLSNTGMKSIRTLLFLVLAGMIMCSCGASYQEAKERRAAEKEAERAAFAAALQNCDFTLEITRIIPRGYPSRESVGEYRLRLEKDVVTTRLPFLGESREAAYGGDEISIVFNKEKVNLIKDFARRMMEDERQLRNFEEQVEDNKTFAALRENVTLEEKKISQDKFNALA